MNKQDQLAKAIRIATYAHMKQFDKGGNPYILHPLHLMTQLLFDTQLATIAVLHDVIEDSDYTIKELVNLKFSNRITNAVALLTHLPHMTYDEYIKGITGNYDAIRVKRKDLAHNLDVTRLKNKDELTDKDIARIIKYHKAFIRLTAAKRDFERK